TELERCGIIVSMPGRGSMVLAERESLRDEMSGKLENAMTALAREMRESGIDKEEFVRAAEEAWDRTGGKPE
ncbi:MAG: hypothetical protein IKI93_05565, partial [Clostridia bacterium]|nr:hypothetical protein [Clostridia bacterium]